MNIPLPPSRFSILRPFRAASLAAALLASPALLVNQASAGTTFNGNAAAVTGNWDAAANWEGTLPTFNATADLFFRNFSTNNRTTSLIASAKTVRSLTFNSNVNSGFEIRLTNGTNASPMNLTMGNATNAAAITVDSGAVGNITIGKGSGTAGNDGNLILANDLAVAQNSATATLIVDRPITESGGSYGLTKNGAGTLTLSGNNTYTGATTVNAGTVTIGATGRLGSGSYAQNITNDGTFIYSGTTAQTLSGIISGTGALTKNAASTLTLSGANTYTGTTLVTAGTLLVNGALAAGSAVTVDSGATLGGSGTINGAAVVNGNLRPGNSPGVLTFGSSLTLSATSAVTMELNGTVRGTDYDGIDVTGALTYGGALTINVGSAFLGSSETFSLFTSASQSGGFASVSLEGAYDTGSFTNSSGVWNLTDSSGNQWSFSQATGNLGFTAVPEPSTWAMLASALGLLAVSRYRLARKK
jgi:autotransporter-associated beta strand protein